jgi:hypothetical protein
MSAPFFVLNCNISKADSTDFPRTWSATSRAFWADILAPFNFATTSTINYLFQSTPSLTLGLFVRYVATIGTRRRKFTQLMTNHLFVDRYRNMLTSIMDSNSQANHVWQYHRPARPSFNWPAFVVRYSRLNLFCKVLVDEWSFL